MSNSSTNIDPAKFHKFGDYVEAAQAAGDTSPLHALYGKWAVAIRDASLALFAKLGGAL